MEYNKFSELYVLLTTLDYEIEGLEVQVLSVTHIVATYLGSDAGMFFSDRFHYVAQQTFNIDKLLNELQKHL